MENILDELILLEGLSPKDRVEYANVYFRELNDEEKAIEILTNMRNVFLKMENMIKIKGFSNNSISRKNWNTWQKIYPDVVSSLVYIYNATSQKLEAEGVLVDWISRFPNDNNAKQMLEDLRIKN